MKISFTLFKNSNKKSPKHPDFTSSQKDDEGNWINIMSCWIRRAEDGSPKQDKNGNMMIGCQLDTDELQRYIDYQEAQKEKTAEASKEEMDAVFS
jgi:hypothetical protein